MTHRSSVPKRLNRKGPQMTPIAPFAIQSFLVDQRIAGRNISSEQIQLRQPQTRLASQPANFTHAGVLAIIRRSGSDKR